MNIYLLMQYMCTYIRFWVYMFLLYMLYWKHSLTHILFIESSPNCLQVFVDLKQGTSLIISQIRQALKSYCSLFIQKTCSLFNTDMFVTVKSKSNLITSQKKIGIPWGPFLTTGVYFCPCPCCHCHFTKILYNGLCNAGMTMLFNACRIKFHRWSVVFSSFTKCSFEIFYSGHH